MKKMGSLVLAVCLLLGCVGCDGGEQEEIYSSALGETATDAAAGVGEELGQESSSSEEEETAFFADPNDPAFNYLESRPSPEELFPVEENTEFSGTLTISTSIGSEMLENWAAAFEAAYPNVEVEIDAGFDSVAAAARAEEQGGAWSGKPAEPVELFSGDGGDIVELTTAPYQRYMESGLFLDLNQLMDSDPDFHREEYYTNVLEAWETEGGALPVVGTVAPHLLYFNKAVLEDLGHQ